MLLGRWAMFCCALLGGVLCGLQFRVYRVGRIELVPQQAKAKANAGILRCAQNDSADN